MLRNKTQVKSLKFPLKQENLIRYSIFYNRFHFRTKLKSVTKCLLSAHMAHNQMELFDVIFKTMFEPHWNQVDMFKWQMAPFTRQKTRTCMGTETRLATSKLLNLSKSLLNMHFLSFAQVTNKNISIFALSGSFLHVIENWYSGFFVKYFGATYRMMLFYYIIQSLTWNHNKYDWTKLNDSNFFLGKSNFCEYESLDVEKNRLQFYRSWLRKDIWWLIVELIVGEFLIDWEKNRTFVNTIY